MKQITVDDVVKTNVIVFRVILPSCDIQQHESDNQDCDKLPGKKGR